MSHLPTREPAVTEVPSPTYYTSHSTRAHQQFPQPRGPNLFSEPYQHQDLPSQDQYHNVSRAAYQYQRDDDGTFRAPGVHAILNPPLQTSQISPHTPSPKSDRRRFLRPHSSSFTSNSLSPQPRDPEAANPHYSPIPAPPVSAQSAAAPDLAVPPGFSHHRLFEPYYQRPGETAPNLQLGSASHGGGSPIKRRKTIQTPPSLRTHEPAAHKPADHSRYFPGPNVQGSGASPARPGDSNGPIADSPSFPQIGKARGARAHQRQESLSSAEQQISPQFMTLQTDQGPLYLPVDTQAASRFMDEKRRRNAGASARFRARRKEREQASSQEIDDLRTMIRDLGEEVQFYRTERDFLANVLLQDPDHARHFPRPPSPRRYRGANRPEDPTTSRRSADPTRTSPSHQGAGTRDTTSASPKQSFPPITPLGGQVSNVAPSQQPAYRERVEALSPIRGPASRGQQQLEYSPEPPQAGEQYQTSPGRPGQSHGSYGW